VRGAAFWIVVLLAPSAHAQSECVESYEGAQELRAAGRLREARAALHRCIDGCSGAPRKDCSEWLDDVERAIPTVVLDFVDAHGRSRSDVRVTVDGETVAEQLDGRAIALDPGARTFVLEPSGQAPVTRRFTLLEGDKRRKIAVSLARSPKAATPDPPTKPPPDRGWAAPHWSTWALGGVALVGFGLFAGFGIHSLELEDCADTCSDDQVDRIRDERVAADVGLAIGATALAAALVVGLVTSSSEVSLKLGPALLVLR
jgi:hypothetical protein